MIHLNRYFKSIVKACPYTILGKKGIEIFKAAPKSDKNIENKMQRYKTGMKTGRNISLVGVFCPFLWYAILSGASKEFIMLNVIHSALFVVLGLLILGVNYVALYRYNSAIEKR
ncbi:hypothetical protein [Membranihabitans marinus]|uniref:hypothetical protein n=1 Tax=Membranihabitans marinus TaxID=1227546 RepID=UPI001F486CBC|nr:hypothetical protein [Membranihabitans marinus]